MSALAKYAYTATGMGLVKTAEGFVTLVEGTLKSLAKVVDKAELRRIYETIGQKEWKFANGDVPTAEQMDEIIDYLVRSDFSESFEDVLKRYEQGLFDGVDGKKVLGGLEAGAKESELFGMYRGNKVKVESSRIDFSKASTPEELAKIDSWPKRPRSNEPVSGGFDHTLDQHFNRPLANSRSIFSITPEKLKTIIKSSKVINSKLVDAGGGIYYRIVDVGENIGNSALKFGGKETSYIKVFTDVKGVYINAYPIPKP